MARKYLSEAKNTISDWQSILSDIVRYKSFLTENIEQYLAKDITKKELAKQFLSMENMTLRERYLQGIQNIDSVMQKYSGQINGIRASLLFGYPGLTDIFDNNSIQRLEFVQKAITVESMADIARRGDLSGIIFGISDAIRDNIKQLNLHITDPLLDIRLKLKTIETNLREYQDSIKMDSQFYL